MITHVEVSRPARLSSLVSEATVRLVRAAELATYLEAWQQLGDQALFPNIAYEPWMVLPVLKASSNTDHLYFLLVFGPEEKELWGFIPLEKQSRCLHLPIRNLAFWQHRYCYVTAPLLHLSHARETLDAFWRWFESNRVGARVLDTNWLLADGEFHDLWIDFAMGRVSLMLNDFPRALFRTEKPLSEYLSRIVSRKSQLEFQRRERRLAELGALEYRAVDAPGAVDAWLEDFLKLEAAGWKGETGGAPSRHMNRTPLISAPSRGKPSAAAASSCCLSPWMASPSPCGTLCWLGKAHLPSARHMTKNTPGIRLEPCSNSKSCGASGSVQACGGWIPAPRRVTFCSAVSGASAA